MTPNRNSGILTPNRLRGAGLATPGERFTTVFDRAKGRGVSASAENLSRRGGDTGSLFRVTERDKAPAREVVTALLLGDPAPGRPMPPEPAVERERICTDSGPVLLTFGEYRRHYGEG